MILVAILGLLFAAIIYIPQWWTRHVLIKHSQPNPSIPGTGAQFAEHLLGRLNITNVRVEEALQGMGDHYDPIERVVRLTPENYHGNSLTAIVTAAHEVGHASQHADKYPPLMKRTQMVMHSQHLEKLAGVALIAFPFITYFTHSPLLGGLMVLAGALTMLSGVVVHMITLPVEIDASFARALPMLERGGYLNQKDMKSARTILKACAWTYVASSLSSLLNVWKWLRALKR